MAAVPLVVPWTTTPIDLGQVVSIVNENRFVRRLQVYPELQPGVSRTPHGSHRRCDWL
jgi:hypothetical protein